MHFLLVDSFGKIIRNHVYLRDMAMLNYFKNPESLFIYLFSVGQVNSQQHTTKTTRFGG